MQPDRRDVHPLLEGPLRQALAGAAPGLLLDFDGTLSEIVTDPDAARLNAACAAAIDRLLSVHVPLAVVSGRKVQDLEARIPYPQAWLSGVHGAELVVPGPARLWASPTEPVRTALEAFIGAARELAPWGVRVEDKRLAVAAHVRAIEDPARRREAVSRLMLAAQSASRSGAVSWMEGKAVIEVRSREACKANAVRMLLRRWPPGTFLIAMGDDTTDEEMFIETLNVGGTAVKVGDGPTAAPHRLEDPADVARFLAALAHELEARPPSADGNRPPSRGPRQR